MYIVDSKCLLSALYARNPVSTIIQDRLDAVLYARHVGKRNLKNVQKLDVFTLIDLVKKVEKIESFSKILTHDGFY